MTPRAPVTQGRPGLGQEKFPEEAKELGRNLGLTQEITILRNTPEDDGGGAPRSNWAPLATVRGRIDPITSSTRGQREEIADQVKESSTHLATLDPGVDVTTNDRLEVDGVTWIITTKLARTDPLTTRLAVRGL